MAGRGVVFGRQYVSVEARFANRLPITMLLLVKLFPKSNLCGFGALACGVDELSAA